MKVFDKNKFEVAYTCCTISIELLRIKGGEDYEN